MQTEIYKQIIKPFYNISGFHPKDITDDYIFEYSIKSLNSEKLEDAQFCYFGGDKEKNLLNYKNDILLIILNRNNKKFKELRKGTQSICPDVNLSFKKMLTKLYEEVYSTRFTETEEAKYNTLKQVFINLAENILPGIYKKLLTYPPEKAIPMAMELKNNLTISQLSVLEYKLTLIWSGKDPNHLIPKWSIDYDFGNKQNLKKEFIKIQFNKKNDFNIKIDPIDNYKIFVERGKSIEDLMKLFPNVSIDDGIELFSTKVQVGHSAEPNALYITDRQFGDKAFFRDTIENKDFYKYISCNDILELFLFQAALDNFSCAFNYPEYKNYKVLLDKEKIERYKDVLPFEKENPFLNGDEKICVKGNSVYFFKEDHDGIKYVKANVSSRKYYATEKEVLVEKGPWSNMLF